MGAGGLPAFGCVHRHTKRNASLAVTPPERGVWLQSLAGLKKMMSRSSSAIGLSGKKAAKRT